MKYTFVAKALIIIPGLGLYCQTWSVQANSSNKGETRPIQARLVQYKPNLANISETAISVV